MKTRVRFIDRAAAVLRQEDGFALVLALGISVVLGIVGLLYGGITYVRHQHEANLGPISVQTTERKTVPIPPLVAAVVLVAGGALLMGRSGARPQP